MKLNFILIRYFLVLLLGLGNLFLFYQVLTPITTYLVKFTLSFFSASYTVNSTIFFKSVSVELIPACIAGSAYYLLVILNLSSADISALKRVVMVLFSFALLLIFNVFRIVLLVLISNSDYFATVHLFFWYFLSTIFVVLIWIFSVIIFKIKSIPVYSDFKEIFSIIKGKE